MPSPGPWRPARTSFTAAAGNLKKITLELGGKSPVVIYDDADLDTAVEGRTRSRALLQGEACTAGSRLYVQRSIYDEVRTRIQDRVPNLRIGASSERDVVIGLVINEQQRSKVISAVDDATRDGAEVVAGGAEAPGYFLEPTVLGEVHDAMAITREELFGPVLSLMPFDDEAEVIRRTNDTSYGLAAGVRTTDLGRAHRYAESVNAGAVWVNCYNVFDAALPSAASSNPAGARKWGQKLSTATSRARPSPSP